MPSFQSLVCRIIVRRMMRGVAGRTIGEVRQITERNAGRFRMPKGIDVRTLTIAGRAAEWLVPSGQTRNAAILYLHGGAYVTGSLRSHRSLAAGIAKASGIAVLTLDYRLAPENPYPAALDDAVHAFDFLVNLYGIPAQRLLLAGDSAGGGLALATALRLRDRSGPLPAGVICLSPWTNLAMDGESFGTRARRDPFFTQIAGLERAASAYAGANELDHPEISPLNARLDGLPPLFLQVGDDEVLLSDSEELARKALACGVEAQLEIWPRMWHVWQIFGASLPEARRALTSIGAFAHRTIG
ncbi:MAG: alpha/beta hydrolase [Phyllobacterium sp.]